MPDQVGAVALSASTIPGLADAVSAAASAANEVDRDARFPHEAIDALKQAQLLSCGLPLELGGQAYRIADLAVIARELGAACSAAGMVFAMHQTQALVLAKYARTGPAVGLAKIIAANQSLIASATTESTTGGDIGSSTCAIVNEGDVVLLEKNAPVISYAEHADYIGATARRHPDAAKNDQVLLLCPAGDTELKRTSTWDTMGFRGTCSPGYLLSTRTSPANLIPADYASILATTMLPASHTLWASVWLGIADAAYAKARTIVRQAARKAPDKTVPQASLLADLTVTHQSFESMVLHEVRRYQSLAESGADEATIGFTVAMNNLKIAASTAVIDVVTEALKIVGLNGYRDDHALSMGRLLRDAFGPQLMVSNERIRLNNANLVLAYRG
ncbi:acyl-CoA dehydrogenase family protein [Mycolicibacterium sp. CBMA 226]|uniref:acyl-CoA dehydrogenase family protein n=1 Tax=Mycolicibacterium sp. CBMA 226 TaxID=2606611 RepID=UPI0012DCDECB|nr:acyl-CoA dehydrogenase family protein [Mycolicibacterium sp. CBMA 226]MUL78114.1 acyl-CoA dehydrogenase [Mycolicibacterium sp. CBMA 226]